MNISEINKKKVIEFLRLIEEGKAGEISELFAENGEHNNVYASGLFPEKVVGREAIKEYWEAPISNFEKMEFPIEEIHSMEESSIVYIKFKGLITLPNNGGTYENNYYAIFRFNENNEIKQYEEIFNPIVAARGFGFLDKIK